MATLGVIKVIEAAHGTGEIHGHNFKIEVALEGKVKNGMVEGIDFHDAIGKVDGVLKNLNKKNLNNILGEATVENIAIYIIKKLNDLPIYYVKVWETENRYAQIFAEEILS